MAGELARSGCTTVFGIMGDGNMSFMIACGQAGLDVLEARHEASALGMAEGCSWSSGQVGVCTVTHGPGLTQLATSLMVASRNRSSVVIVTAETPPGYGGAQFFDQRAFIESCEASYRTPTPDESAPSALREAMWEARVQRRPVVLALRADLFDADAIEVAEDWAPPVLERSGSTDDVTAAAQRVVSLLSAAERPVVVAGRGAMGEPVADLVAQLAQRTGAGLATTWPAKGLFSGSPGDLGVAGGLSSPLAWQIMQEPDLVLGVGASMGRSTTQSGRLFPRAHIVGLHEEAPGHPGVDRPDTIICPPADTLRRALDLLEGQPDRTAWFGEVPTPAEAWQADLDDHSPQLDPGTVDPRRVLAAISPLLPEDALVVVSNGHCSGFVGGYLAVPSAGRLFLAQGCGSIGHAFPTAVGVAIGDPTRKVVVFEGDTGFMMHSQEVETAARAGVDVTLFVLNDNAMGTEYQRLVSIDAEADYAVIRSGKFADVARALGAQAWEMTEDDPSVLRSALEPGLKMVDVRTSRSVVSRHLRLPKAAATASAT